MKVGIIFVKAKKEIYNSGMFDSGAKHNLIGKDVVSEIIEFFDLKAMNLEFQDACERDMEEYGITCGHCVHFNKKAKKIYFSWDLRNTKDFCANYEFHLSEEEAEKFFNKYKYDFVDANYKKKYN